MPQHEETPDLYRKHNLVNWSTVPIYINRGINQSGNLSLFSFFFLVAFFSRDDVAQFRFDGTLWDLFFDFK